MIRVLLQLSEAGSDAVLTRAEAQCLDERALDRLLRVGVLREGGLLSAWSVCTACECGLGARPLDAEAERFRARCPLDADRDVVLDPPGLRTFRLDATAFASFLARSAGLSEEAEVITPGIWRLGAMPSRRVVAACFERRVLNQPHLPTILGNIASPCVTLLGPRVGDAARIALGAAGIACLELQDVCSIDAAGRAVMHMELLAPSGSARLVIDARTQRVFVDGTPQRVPRQPFILLEMLIEAALGGRSVSAFDIQQRFSSRAAKDLVRNLRNALSRARSNTDEIRGWIAADRSTGTFRVTLAPEEIELRR